MAAASSPLAPPNCSSSMFPNRASGVPTRTVYINVFTWWYMSPLDVAARKHLAGQRARTSELRKRLGGHPRRIGHFVPRLYMAGKERERRSALLHSARSATTGSTRDARRAGSQAAATAAPIDTAVTLMRVTPSPGLTPN